MLGKKKKYTIPINSQPLVTERNVVHLAMATKIMQAKELSDQLAKASFSKDSAVAAARYHRVKVTCLVIYVKEKNLILYYSVNKRRF